MRPGPAPSPAVDLCQPTNASVIPPLVHHLRNTFTQPSLFSLVPRPRPLLLSSYVFELEFHPLPLRPRPLRPLPNEFD